MAVLIGVLPGPTVRFTWNQVRDEMPWIIESIQRTMVLLAGRAMPQIGPPTEP